MKKTVQITNNILLVKQSFFFCFLFFIGMNISTHLSWLGKILRDLPVFTSFSSERYVIQSSIMTI